MKISMKTDGSAPFWMKFGPIFTLAAWKNCRDGKTHRRFWKAFEKLPAPIQDLA